MTLKLTFKDILFAYLYFYWIAPRKVFCYFYLVIFFRDYSLNCANWILNDTIQVIQSDYFVSNFF